MANHIKHKIIIKDLTISVNLGMTLEEQKSLQEIRWTIQFTSTINEDCQPVVCYQEVSDKIKSYSQGDKFSSMEELVLFCYDKIKKDFPKIKSLSLSLHKTSPPLKDLSGGVFFEYGDF